MDEMKTILVITDNLQDQINGVVTTFKNIEEMAVLDGYRILYLDPGQFLHVGCPGYPEVKISVPWQIGKKIEAMAPDYIHIATEGPIGLCARLYLDQRGCSYNTSYHTKFPEFINKLYRIPTSWTYAYVRWFHKHSGRVLTTTRGMVEDLEANGFEKVIPWTRGVNRDDLKPTKKRTTNGAPVLLSVGRVSKEKGLEDLIALQWEFDIVIVGDGPYRAELEKRMPTAQFVGYKSGSELANYYQDADVFLFPSRTDTFGLVMIEAMSLGTPVAAYPVRGPLDVIEQNVTGVMNNSLYLAVRAALDLDRAEVKKASQVWTWEACWKIFKDNLIDKSGTR
jgi:glycosyltransferase involved in cell wall biosynthesis